jgi:hypothetical protein
LFWWEGVDGQKIAPTFFEVNFHSDPSFSLFLSFLSLCSSGFGRKMLWEEVEGSIQSIHCQKSTLRYVNITTNNLLWAGPDATFVAYNATINI